MLTYFRKIAVVIREIARTRRQNGWTAALRLLRRKLWFRSCVMVFAKDPDLAPVAMPDGVSAIVVLPQQQVVPVRDILVAGAGEDIGYLNQGATCYLLYRHGVPAALGWLFESSRLLERAGLAASGKYVAGFFVQECERGQGLYPLLLRLMSRDVSAMGYRTLADTVVGNYASRRGLEKAGFSLIGELRSFVIIGLIVACRFQPVNPRETMEKHDGL